MKAALHLGEECASQLRVTQALVNSAIVMILVVHILEGPVLSYSMLWAYLVVGALAWIVARGRGRSAIAAMPSAAVSAWCGSLLVGAYPPWTLGGL